MGNKYQAEIKEYLNDVQKKADKLVDKFVIVFFIIGICLSPIYQTWEFSLIVSGLNFALYIISKLLTNRFLSRQIISLIFSIFLLQYIGQMHGMAELHFIFFTNIAILIIYQDWKVMVPYTVFALGHHSTFFYFQMQGYDNLGQYFINYTQVTFQVLFFHFGIAILMAVISGWWATFFRNQSIQMLQAQMEIQKKNKQIFERQEELNQMIEELETSQENVTRINLDLKAQFSALDTIWGYMELDADQNVIKANTLFADWLGYQINEIQKVKHLDLFFEDETDKHAKLWRTLNQGQNVSNVFKRRSKTGEIVWFYGAYSPILDIKSGKLIRVIKIASNYNEQVHLRNEENSHKRHIEKILKDITSSINSAKRIQNAMIPSAQVVQKVFDKNFIYYLPRDIVSGDFYWVQENKGQKMIAVGDCTGHGVPGALMTIIAINFLNQVSQNTFEPDKILTQISGLIQQSLGHSEGVRDAMDMIILKIEPHQNQDVKLTFSGAMSSLYLVQNQEIQILKGDKVPIGLNWKNRFNDYQYQKHELQINQPTMLYLCSDGYKDQFGGIDNTKFGSKQFKNLLLNIAEMPVNNQKEKVESEFVNWKGNYKQIDDVVFVGVQIF